MDDCLTLRCSLCDLWLCSCCQRNLDQANSGDNDSSSDDTLETSRDVGAVRGSADDIEHDTDSDTGVVSGAGAVAVVVSAPTSAVDSPLLPKDVLVASIKGLRRFGGGARYRWMRWCEGKVGLDPMLYSPRSLSGFLAESQKN